MKKINITFEMYDAKEVIPAKTCDVMAITHMDCSTPCMMTMTFNRDNGCFNNTAPMDVLYWAYMPKTKDVDPEHEEEDDF